MRSNAFISFIRKLKNIYLIEHLLVLLIWETLHLFIFPCLFHVYECITKQKRKVIYIHMKTNFSMYACSLYLLNLKMFSVGKSQ